MMSLMRRMPMHHSPPTQNLPMIKNFPLKMPMKPLIKPTMRQPLSNEKLYSRCCSAILPVLSFLLLLRTSYNDNSERKRWKVCFFLNQSFSYFNRPITNLSVLPDCMFTKSIFNQFALSQFKLLFHHQNCTVPRRSTSKNQNRAYNLLR